jgi:predicted helicase
MAQFTVWIAWPATLRLSGFLLRLGCQVSIRVCCGLQFDSLKLRRITPAIAEKFADNLKRELPRIPLAPDFAAFSSAGQELARLHLEYESLDEWPLEWIETPGVPLSYRVEKMKLSKDKTALAVNPSLTLAGIPPETFRYRLGNRSALEWVIDQYQVSEDKRSGIRSDPNRADDPQYSVRLVGQVVRVSLETVRIVDSLPASE